MGCALGGLAWEASGCDRVATVPAVSEFFCASGSNVMGVSLAPAPDLVGFGKPAAFIPVTAGFTEATGLAVPANPCGFVPATAGGLTAVLGCATGTPLWCVALGPTVVMA